MTDYAELRRLAEAATPGPWHFCRDKDDCAMVTVAPGADCSTERSFIAVAAWADNDDAAYIAALSPDVVLGLLDRILELEKEPVRVVHDSPSLLAAARREADKWEDVAETLQDRLRAAESEAERLRGALAEVRDNIAEQRDIEDERIKRYEKQGKEPPMGVVGAFAGLASAYAIANNRIRALLPAPTEPPKETL